MDSIIELVPDFKGKIWGGRRLETEFGYEIPAGPVGECWAISAHENGDDVIASGAYAGKTLSWLWAEHRELFGNCEGDVFPLLVKIIDADDDLSIQVHPDDAYAGEHENGSLGKKECWYVLSAEEGGTIVVGQNASSREEFAQMVEEGRWDELLNVIPIHTGDFFQIDPGCVHAIKGGTVILETQQSSDVTYRVYDYDRPGDDGQLRPLHLAQSLDVIDYGMAAPESGAVTAPEVDGVTTLVTTDCYTVERLSVAGELTFPTPYPFTCVSVIEGEGTVNGKPVKKGSHLLALSACDALELTGTMTVITSHL
ncbi:MAG: class I mannose-6-phosphate isomerase [Coriobacteriaceae bacterium]|nr:class I mannose-6-phosphate isomerase [Coriobacteriaceae bacterium]